MEEESVFDFEQEINDQYAAQYDEDMIFDDYSSGIDAESYDPWLISDCLYCFPQLYDTFVEKAVENKPLKKG